MRAVEPPPPQYASGPPLTGRTVERQFDGSFALQALCTRHLGPLVHGYYQACYVPALDEVAVPSKKAWPSAKERAVLRAHEWAHARGWRHPLDMKSASRERWRKGTRPRAPGSSGGT